MPPGLETRAIRVVIADDQTLFREGLARLLEDDLEVVGRAGDGAEAVALARRLKPDVVLMDLKMPGVGGVEATRSIRQGCPGVKVLVLTTFANEASVTDALEAGATGYLMKDAGAASLVAAIRSVVGSEPVLDGEVAVRVHALLTGAASPRDHYEGLTPRELEILRLIATGEGNKQVARRLGISEKTVRNHISHVYEKLEIFDRSQAVLWAVRKGLVEL